MKYQMGTLNKNYKGVSPSLEVHVRPGARTNAHNAFRAPVGWRATRNTNADTYNSEHLFASHVRASSDRSPINNRSQTYYFHRNGCFSKYFGRCAKSYVLETGLYPSITLIYKNSFI